MPGWLTKWCATCPGLELTTYVSNATQKVCYVGVAPSVYRWMAHVRYATSTFSWVLPPLNLILWWLTKVSYVCMGLLNCHSRMAHKRYATAMLKRLVPFSTLEWLPNMLSDSHRSVQRGRNDKTSTQQFDLEYDKQEHTLRSDTP